MNAEQLTRLSEAWAKQIDAGARVGAPIDSQSWWWPFPWRHCGMRMLFVPLEHNDGSTCGRHGTAWGRSLERWAWVCACQSCDHVLTVYDPPATWSDY